MNDYTAWIWLNNSHSSSVAKLKLTMTLAEVFGAGNCMRDMEFHLLFDRLGVFKADHLNDRGKRYILFALA